MKQPTRVVIGERRKIEEAGDIVDVEQVHLVGPPRQADRDHRNAREERISFPRFEWHCRQQVVLAEDHVRLMRVSCCHCVAHADNGRSIDTQLSKELSEVVAEELMATDT